MAASKVTFPLPDAALPRAQFTGAQTKRMRIVARELVAQTLAQEMRFRYEENETLDARAWKFVKSKERMRVHKRVAPPEPDSSDPLLPTVLAVGCLEGRLEDALYGMHHKTTDEMRTTTAFLNKHHLDAAVLANIDVGTDEDRFRYLGVKWRVAQTPGGHLIKNRDVSTLESSGIDVDALGGTYGFHLMKSVDLPDLLPFPESVVVRAQVMLCCIYRQITPTLVSVYCKSIFNLSGELLDYMSFLTAADMVLGISKALECAAAKRLTALAMQKNSPSLLPDPSRLSLASSRDSRATEGSMNEYLDDTASNASGSTTTSKGSSREWSSAASSGGSSKDTCSVCTKKKRFFFSGPPMRTCRICEKAACPKCYVKAYLLAKPRSRKVVCCKACVVESRELDVDPRDAYPCLPGPSSHNVASAK
uniref:FYVE-type domain-containing protein n=1 Tax=Globisporangium ultimum (strain ATCC 200006 / CBS 805.95 / DAOM BR144) TaxID=431595 RepID=K3WXE4_GLOUD